jgi:hypothetical protein
MGKPEGYCANCSRRDGHHPNCVWAERGDGHVRQSTPAPLWPIYEFPCSCGRTIRGGHPVTGVGVAPSIRHESSGRDLAVFHWHAEARAWSVTRDEQAIQAIITPKPPTLRKWLGDRVSELGRWAEVLREQPVPAGRIVKWEWREPCWLGFDRCGGRYTLGLHTVFDVVTGDRLRDDAFDMCLFTRHPDVKPEPKLRTWFGNEEEL